jgi:sec-independent protein translocase protein TatB
MFDIGGSELLVIAVVALVVLGPKELPAAVRNIQGFVRKARSLAHDFQTGLSEMAREIELDKMKAEVEQAINPGELDSLGNTIHKELTAATDEFKKTFDPDQLKDYVAPGPGEPEAIAAEPAAAEIAGPPASEALPQPVPAPKPGA